MTFICTSIMDVPSNEQTEQRMGLLVGTDAEEGLSGKLMVNRRNVLFRFPT